MKIQNHSNINFGIKLNTGNVLEVTSLKIFQSDGITGIKDVVNTLNGKPANFSCYGHKGFKYQAKQIGAKIMDKYPEIKSATDEIISITNKNPDMSKSELNDAVKPLIENLGKEIDITI